MDVYNLIADNYETIFPLDTEKVSFIQSVCPPPAERILDAGCATGELAVSLAQSGYKVVGIDLNHKMIERAQYSTKRAGKCKGSTDFSVHDMRDIVRLGNFDAVLCFGNTLVHLDSEYEVCDFFASVHACLSERGIFVFQVLNYDTILLTKKADFKVVETEFFIFKRKYVFSDTNKIKFEICFEDKKTGKTYTDSIDLLPLKQNTLFSFLRSAGFSQIDAFSDYGTTKSNLREYATIYCAKKT